MRSTKCRGDAGVVRFLCCEDDEGVVEGFGARGGRSGCLEDCWEGTCEGVVRGVCGGIRDPGSEEWAGGCFYGMRKFEAFCSGVQLVHLGLRGG